MSCRCDCDQCSLPCTCESELASTHAPRLELVRSVPSRPPIQMTGGRVPFGRRLRRFARALLAFFTAQRIDLS